MSSSTAKVKSVSVQPEYLTVALEDGRIIQAPVGWYPTLHYATKTERKTWKRCGAGRGIHWPLLDYHLSIPGLLSGAHEGGEFSHGALAEA